MEEFPGKKANSRIYVFSGYIIKTIDVNTFIVAVRNVNVKEGFNRKVKHIL